MLYDIIVCKQKYHEVANKYHQKLSYVGGLVNKLKNNREFIWELIDKQEGLAQNK